MASAGPDKNLTVIPIDVLTAPEPTQVAETIADTLPEALPKPVAEPVPEPVPKAMVEPVAEPNVESDKKNYEDPDAENKSENDLKWELTSEEEQELESSEGTDSDSVVDFEAVEKAEKAEKAESDEKNARKAVLKAQRKGYFTSQELDAVEKELERESLTDKEEIIISPLPTYTDLIEKNRTPSEYSYTMDDNDIEKVLQKDRVDEFDNIDTPLQTKPTGINTLTLKENFLELFEIPSLSDISEEQEIKPISPKLKRRATQFINSMKKGSSLATVESSDSFSIEGSDGLEHMALSAFASLINIPEHQKSKSVEIDLFALSKPELKFCDTDMSEKRTSNLLSMTMELLKDLLDKVVQNAEINKINRSLRSKLDNESLWWKLKKEVDAFMYQRELNNFLNARMVDYYKRMKSQRQFQRLPNSLIVTEYNRRNDALKLYDHVVNVAKETKKKVSYLMASVLMDLTYVENIERDTEEHLENVIVETINRKNSEHLQKVAEREIRLMNKKRDEMSDVRLALITRKHTLARITGKIETIEKISDVCVMEHFIYLQNEVAALQKKIEEKNFDLRKLRNRYDMDLHLAQHNRDKTLSLQCRLSEAKEKFNTIMLKQRNLRELLYKGKLERNIVRKKLADVVYSGGLLTMPLLLHDYDETVQQVSTMQAKVSDLRETMNSMNQKIADCEASISIIRC